MKVLLVVWPLALSAVVGYDQWREQEQHAAIAEIRAEFAAAEERFVQLGEGILDLETKRESELAELRDDADDLRGCVESLRDALDSPFDQTYTHLC